MYDWTVASPSAGIRMRPHLCATQTAAFTCRLQTNPLMGLHHSTHFSDRQTHGDAATLQTTRRIEPFPSAAIQFMIKCESDISCQKHLKPQNNTFLLIFFQICGRKRNASPKPYSLPIPWVTFSLSVPTPPHLLPFILFNNQVLQQMVRVQQQQIMVGALLESKHRHREQHLFMNG